MHASMWIRLVVLDYLICGKYCFYVTQEERKENRAGFEKGSREHLYQVLVFVLGHYPRRTIA